MTYQFSESVSVSPKGAILPRSIMMCSPHTDDELRDWFLWQTENGSSFIRRLVEAAYLADAQAYMLLRPLLLELKAKYPQEG